MNTTASVLMWTQKLCGVTIAPIPFRRLFQSRSRNDESVSKAKTIHSPAIEEAFVNTECTLKDVRDLSGAGITSMFIGQVQHISVGEEYAQGYEKRYRKDGFMMLIPAPQNLKTGEPNQSAIATINIEKYD